MRKIKFCNNALWTVRRRLHLTQEQMGMKLGISVSMMKQVESGRRSLSFDKLLKLAEMEMELNSMAKKETASIEIPARLPGTTGPTNFTETGLA